VDNDFALQFEIEKSDPTGKLVSGWFYVHKNADGQVVDYSGDVIEDIGVLREAAHDFLEHRVAKSKHGKDIFFGDEPVGDIVESIIIDDDVAKALGMTSKARGWWGSMRISDAKVQKAVREGNLKQFSFGGRMSAEDIAA
jgi:hypothetical protein